MVVGLLLAIVASVLHATADAAKKGLAGRMTATDALTVYILFGLPVVALLWWATGLQGMPQPRFWLYLPLSVVPNLVANLLFFEAVRVSPLSLTLPFLAFTPAFLIGTSWLVNAELPTAGGAAGIALVVLGALLLHRAELSGGILGPLRAIARERGSRLMCAVALIWSISAAADKAAVLTSGPLTYLFLWHVGMALPLTLAMLVRRRVSQVLAHPALALGASGLHVAAAAAQMAALPLLQASYVISIKRAGMVVGIFYGWFFFGEHQIRTRLLGAAVMLAGVACITLA